MGVVADIERNLTRLRAEQENDGVPGLRTSTMTHLVWAPPRWLARAQGVLAGLAERHPARTIFLVPEPGKADGIVGHASVKDFPVGDGREVLSEVIELHLRGRVADHPASVVLPLLISELPVFCRWRGEPAWGSPALVELSSVCDRFVIDSNEWTGHERAYAELASRLDGPVVSDLAWRRTLPWRARLAELWPGIGNAKRLRIEGPKADALLLHAWLCSRLRTGIRLVQSPAEGVAGIQVDGVEVAPPFTDRPTGSQLLSAELDTLARDPVYEAAVSRFSPTRKPA